MSDKPFLLQIKPNEFMKNLTAFKISMFYLSNSVKTKKRNGKRAKPQRHPDPPINDSNVLAETTLTVLNCPPCTDQRI